MVLLKYTNGTEIENTPMAKNAMDYLNGTEDGPASHHGQTTYWEWSMHEDHLNIDRTISTLTGPSQH